MTPRVSFIVTTRNSSRTLEGCLRSIRNQVYPDFEIIVVDNGSSDETLLIARKFADKVFDVGPERSTQRNFGAANSTGDILVFVDSDMNLEPYVAAETAEVLSGVAAAVIPEKVIGSNFWDRCRQLEKEAYLGDASVEAARAFRRSSFEHVEGWDSHLTGGEDWDLTDRIRKAGYSVGRIKSFVLHDEKTLSLHDAFRKKRYYGSGYREFLRQPGRKDSRIIRPSLLKPLRNILRDPLHVFGLYLLKLAELAGLAVGMFFTPGHRENIY